MKTSKTRQMLSIFSLFIVLTLLSPNATLARMPARARHPSLSESTTSLTDQGPVETTQAQSSFAGADTDEREARFNTFIEDSSDDWHSAIYGEVPYHGLYPGVDGKSSVAARETGESLTTGNPSAVYCRDLGYHYEIIADDDGQKGICTMPDGEVCDAWEFLQGKCGQRYSYCAQRGYEIETLNDGHDPFSREYAICVTSGGTVVGSVAKLSRLTERAVGCADETFASEALSTPMDEREYTPLATTPPASFDWRNYQSSNWMTSIKNQGGCGSCWAFAAVGVTEAALNIANNDPTLDKDLSEQYLVSDCFTSGSCCGGWHFGALKYIRDSGIPDEGCMTYVDGSGCSCPSACDSGCVYNTGGSCSDRACSDRCGDWQNRLETINSTGRVPSDPQTIKQALVDIGPLVVTIGIGSDFGGSWDGDIYRCTNDDGSNHAVVVVGYDDVGGYWWVKNSWGTGWGDNGYFKMGYGECYVENLVYYADASIVPARVYVDADATGAATGISWTDAYTNVQDALDEANAFGNKTYEIWVAEGIYYPDEDGNGGHVSDAVTETFRLHYNNVHLYGGFSGAETARDQRDWKTNITVLSGDIDGNDVADSHGVVTTTANITGSNAYHVLYVEGGEVQIARSNSIIDGFTLTAGQANGSSPDNRGGALCIDYHWTDHTPPKLANITFSGNSAQYGGALYSTGSSTLTNVIFSRNSAGSWGGALYSSGEPTLINNNFSKNSAGTGGGALYNTGSPTLINNTFSENSAHWMGGALYNNSSPTLTNTILWGNTANSGAQIYNTSSATPTISYSDIEGSGGSGPGWDADLGTDGGGNIDSQPRFVSAEDGNLRLRSNSPAIDAGDNGAVPPNLTTDLDGNPRHIDIPTLDDTGKGVAPIVDMGAYEAQLVPDLSLSKTVSATAFDPGDPIAYILTFSNTGVITATGTVITDVIPVSVTVSHVISNCDVPIAQTIWGGYTYTWDIHNLDIGQGGAITLTGVLSDLLAAGAFTNTASITGTIEETNITNNATVAGVTVRNVKPAASDNHYLTGEDTVLNVPAPGALDGDKDNNGDTLTAVKDDDPLNGTLDFRSDGSFVYTPTLNYNGIVTFTYHATDAVNDSDTALVTITVTAVNDPPVAIDNAYTTLEDTSLSGNVLTDDTGDGADGDVDGDALTAVKDSDPAQGTLTLKSDGTFIYTPTLNYTGTVTFSYHANDTISNSNTALVTITVTDQNTAPVATDNAYTTPEDTPVSGNVLADDTGDGIDNDVDGKTLMAVKDNDPAHGTLTLESDGIFIYTPTLNYNGVITFTYYATDAISDSNTALVTITVTAQNDPPVATDNAYTMLEDTFVSGNVLTDHGADYDVDGDVLIATLDADVVTGALTFIQDGSFTYTPTLNYNGVVTFTYHATDAISDSNIARITLTVIAQNDPPVATDNAYTTLEDTSVGGNVLTDDSGNGVDYDVENDSFVAVLDTDVATGTLALAGDGSFTYTPTLNYNGVATFTYQATGTVDNSTPALVTITVTAVNDPPVATDNVYTTLEDTPLSGNVLTDDTGDGIDNDVDGDTLTVALDTDVTTGTLALTNDGSFTYTPTIDYNGIVAFTYHTSDSHTNSNPATVTITITAGQFVYLPLVLRTGR